MQENTNIEYLERQKADLERQKTEIVADHVRRCGATPLGNAEQWLIAALDWEISLVKESLVKEKDSHA